VDAVVSGVGTGGTLVGMFSGLRETVLPRRAGCLAKPINLTERPKRSAVASARRIRASRTPISEIFAGSAELVTFGFARDALVANLHLTRPGFPGGRFGDGVRDARNPAR